MPIRTGAKAQTMFQKAKAHAVANKLDYYVSYHLLKWAKEQDGVPLGKEHPDMPELSALGTDAQSEFSAAKAAIGGGS